MALFDKIYLRIASDTRHPSKPLERHRRRSMTAAASVGVLREQVGAIREECGHPIIDCDGHFVEFLPDLLPFLQRAGIESEDHLRSICAKAAWGRTFDPGWSKLSRQERQSGRVARPSSHDYAS